MRIRVTVEADEAEEQKRATQTSQARTQSRTFTVPLKDAGEDGPYGSPSPRKRRPRVTPLKRKSSRRQSGPVEDIIGVGSDGSAHQPSTHVTTSSSPSQPVKRARGRPRRSDSIASVTLRPESLTQSDGAGSDESDDNASSSTGPRKGAVVQDTMDVPQEGHAKKRTDFSVFTPLHQKPRNPIVPTAGPLKTPQFMKSLEGRVPTPRKPPGWVDDDEEDNEPEALEREADVVVYGAAESEDSHIHPTIEEHFDHGPDEQARNEEVSFDDEENEAHADQQGPDDSTTALDRSLAESEGFTMVSLESLKSHQQSKAATIPSERPSSRRAALMPSMVQQAIDGEDGSRADPKNRYATSASSSAHQATSNAAAVNAHEGFTSAPSSQSPSSNSRTTSQHLRTRVNQEAPRTAPRPFDAYSSGTRRELRNGFRAGEAMVQDGLDISRSRRNNAASEIKNQSGSSQSASTSEARLPTPADSARDESSSSLPSYDEMSWRPATMPRNQNAAPHVQSAFDGPDDQTRPPVAADAGYDEMSWQPTAPAARPTTQSRYERAARHVHNSVNSSPPMARPDKFSRYENDAVVHANRPTVSYSPAKSDIWYEEADRSLEDSMIPQRDRRRMPRQAPPDASHGSSHRPTSPHEPYHRVEQKKVPLATAQKRDIVPFDDSAPSPIPSLSELLPEDNHPTRSKIPRTWRRTSANDFLYSDETESPQQQHPDKPTPTSTAATASNLPSVFSCWAKSSADANASDSHGREAKAAPHLDQHAAPPGHVQQLRKGILSSPAQRASSPAKEVHWVPDNKLEEMNSAEELDEEYFSSSEESSASELEEADELAVIDRDGADNEDDNDMDHDEDADHPESITSNLQHSQEEPNQITSLRPQHQSLKRPISALGQIRHDTLGNSSLLQPKQKQRRLFEDARIPSPRHDAAKVSPRRRESATTQRKPPVTEQTKTSFLSRLGGWLFAPSITTPIARTPYPAQDMAETLPQPASQSQPTPSATPAPLHNPPYTWTANHMALISHYCAHARRLEHLRTSPLTLDTAPPIPKGPPLNTHYHDPLPTLPPSFTTLIGTQTTAHIHCPLHYPTPAPSLTTNLLSTLGLYSSPSPYTRRDELRCTAAAPARSTVRTSTDEQATKCPGLHPALEGKVYTHTYTPSDIRVAWAFINEVRDKGVPLVVAASRASGGPDASVAGGGGGGGGEGTTTNMTGPERDSSGAVKRIRQDWEAKVERNWVLGKVVACAVSRRAQGDLEALEALERGRGRG